MHRFLPLTLLVLLAIGCVADAATDPDPAGETPAAQPIAFVNVNLVPMDEDRVVPEQTVVVQDDRIVAVGPTADVEVPSGALNIDGTGRYLMPGLAEMHGHIPPPDAPQAFIDAVLFMYVANGITTVRGMLGHEGQLALRDQANAGEIVSPTLYLAGPSFSGGSIESPDQAAAMVRQQHEAGWDLLKVHPGLTLEEYDAMAETANEVGIRFGGHVPEEVGLAHAIEMGQETFDHLDGYIAYVNGAAGPADTARIDEAIRMTLDAGAWVVPTMVLWEVLYGTADLETITSFPELQYMPPDMVESWTDSHRNRLQSADRAAGQHRIENRMRLLEAMNEAGVRILMGTDAPQQFSVPGFSIHRELRRMQDAGMTPYEIIRTGSSNVGEYFANEDDFGTIAEGQRADMILIGANPLESLAPIEEQRVGVMVRGRWLPEEDIQNRLATIASSYQ